MLTLLRTVLLSVLQTCPSLPVIEARFYKLGPTPYLCFENEIFLIEYRESRNVALCGLSLAYFESLTSCNRLGLDGVSRKIFMLRRSSIDIDCYMPVRELRSTSFSVIPVTSSSFPSCLHPSRHFSVTVVSLFYLPLSSFIVSPSFIFRLFLRYGSIPPLLCSEHHFSDLWLCYHTLTSSHSCGWTISLLSSWSYDFIT